MYDMSAIFWTGAMLFVVMACGLAFVVWQSFNRGKKNKRR
jgi:hypothetical protein